ncbi:MAG: hypothetical protein IKI29_01665 [Clostridia bacterium]|nr:hypothetical protein [Clostridia bacterium]
MKEQKKHKIDTVPEIRCNGTDSSVFPFPHYPADRFGNDSDIPVDDRDEISAQEFGYGGDKQGKYRL